MNPIPQNDELPVDRYPFPKINLARKTDIRVSTNTRPVLDLVLLPSGDLVRGHEIGLSVRRGLRKVGRGVKKGAKTTGRGVKKGAKVTTKAAAWAAKRAARIAALPIRKAFLPIAIRRANLLASKKGQGKPSPSDKKQAVRDILAAMAKGNVTLKLGAKILQYTGVSGSPAEICGAFEMGVELATITASAAAVSLALKQLGGTLDKLGIAPKKVPTPAREPEVEAAESEEAPDSEAEAEAEPEAEVEGEDIDVATSRKRFARDMRWLSQKHRSLGVPAMRDPMETLEPLASLLEKLTAQVGKEKAILALEAMTVFLRRNWKYLSYLSSLPVGMTRQSEQTKVKQLLASYGVPIANVSGVGHWALPLAIGAASGMLIQRFVAPRLRG